MSTTKTRKPAASAKTTPKTTRKSPAKSDSAVAAKPTQTKTSVETTEPTVIPKAKAVVLGPVMRKKELIERVVERSGIKKKDAKPVVEAMLSVLGDALAENRELALQPMGKVKIKRERNLPNGRMKVARIRQSSGAATPPTPKPLPDAAE